jgi:hypothetical protein
MSRHGRLPTPMDETGGVLAYSHGVSHARVMPNRRRTSARRCDGGLRKGVSLIHREPARNLGPSPAGRRQSRAPGAAVDEGKCLPHLTFPLPPKSLSSAPCPPGCERSHSKRWGQFHSRGGGERDPFHAGLIGIAALLGGRPLQVASLIGHGLVAARGAVMAGRGVVRKDGVLERDCRGLALDIADAASSTDLHAAAESRRLNLQGLKAGFRRLVCVSECGGPMARRPACRTWSGDTRTPWRPACIVS